MRQRPKLACQLWLALLLASCSSGPYLDYDAGYAFGQARSFYLAPREASDDPLMDQRVATAISSELAARGLSPTQTAEQADLTIHFQVIAEHRPNNNRVSIGMGTGGGGRSSGVSIGGAVSRPVGASTIPYNTIQIDMLSAGSGRLVWRSSDAFELRGDPSRRAEDAQRMVQRLLSGFPPD